MRLIDADALESSLGVEEEDIYAKIVIREAPEVDAEVVVRCKDCKYYNVYRLECHNRHMNGYNNIDGFCNYGERKENE